MAGLWWLAKRQSSAAPLVGRLALAADALTRPCTGKFGLAHHTFSDFAIRNDLASRIDEFRGALCGTCCHINPPVKQG